MNKYTVKVVSDENDGDYLTKLTEVTRDYQGISKFYGALSLHFQNPLSMRHQERKLDLQ